jgi:hypothetical protein
MKYTPENNPKPKFSTKSKEVFINSDDQIKNMIKYKNGIDDLLINRSYEYRYAKYSLEVERMQVKEFINQQIKTSKNGSNRKVSHETRNTKSK